MLFTLLLPAFAQAFTLTQFSPTEFVKSPRQARAVFSEAMVPFGDPRNPAPFEVQCGGKGKGLWEDSRTWIYEFDEELSSGLRCTFQPKSDFKSVKGGSWESPAVQSFHTGAPAILISEPYEGGALEEKPAFFFGLEGPVDLKSVEENAYLLVEGMAERIPLRILPEKTREEMGRTSWQYRNNKKKYFPLALESTRSLPADKKIQFIWGKGIKSQSGISSLEDHILNYQVRRPFRADFSCSREKPKSPCLPISSMSLSFSSSISGKQAAQIYIQGPEGKILQEPSKEEWRSYINFKGPFPAGKKFQLVLPKGIKDDSGRALTNAAKFPLEFSTGTYPPLAKFSANFGIIEARDPVMPVTLRNLEPQFGGAKITGKRAKIDSSNPKALIDWIQQVHIKDEQYIKYEANDKTRDRRSESLLGNEGGAEKFEMPKPNGPEAFEVVGIPLKEKGFHVVELKSQILGKSLVGGNAPMYVASSALVTDLGVHLKWGGERSLIWVTSLDKAAPVDGAKVKVTDCAGKTIWEGKTAADGTVATDQLPREEKLAQCPSDYYRFTGGMFVFAEKGDDFSFTHSSWDTGIEPWRFQISYTSEDERALAHTIFDRTLLRAGQTVHMRHLLRQKYMRGLKLPQGLPTFLSIQPPSGEKIVIPVKFDASGSAESEWKIPESAGLGSYYLSLTDKPKDGEYSAIGAGSFRVEEFRLPVMAGSIQWPKSPLVATKAVPLDLSVRYLNGGGASGLAVKVRSQVEKIGAVSFPEFEDFTFANGNIKLGRERRTYSDEQEAKALKLTDQSLKLDGNGTSCVNLSGLPSWDQPGQLSAEAEYRDPNGQVQTLYQSTRIFPGNTLVGLKRDGWAAQQANVKFFAAAADPSGKPLAGKTIQVKWAEKKSFSHRKRIIGGFYAYDSFDETKMLGNACSGKTNEKGILECSGKAPASGNLILVAETEEGGRVSRAHQDIWVASGEDWWFSAENNDRIDLLPEQKRYEPGETARFQVRMPFREATALITVEREGVIDHFVRTLDSKQPVLELPVKDSYAPNVFVSALLVRGRTAEPQATALVDLAKPAHKLGIGEIRVGWKAHELKVAVETDREEYRVREKAKVKIQAVRASDGKPAGNGTVTLAAVDEALLELMDNSSWRVLEAMMGERSLHVKTSTAQSQVVGKRHFGLKALAAGGGGGQAGSRELFDTLLKWQAVIPLDSNGRAEVEVPLNDSLSSFRIVAVATEGLERFGTGSHSVRTRQDLMLFSGVTPLARHGDRTFPEVTVRNAGNSRMKVEVAGKVEGKTPLAAKTVEIEAGASQIVRWPLTIPESGDALTYEISAKSADASDSVKVKQKLEPAWRVTTIQGTLEQLDKELAMPVAPPAGAVPDTGAVAVRLEPKLAGNLNALEDYMEAYPYNCLEQQVSRVVALGDKDRWKGIAKALPSYLDSDGLLKFFPESLYGSDTLTSYVLSISQEAGFDLPAEHLPTMVQGLQNFVNGKLHSQGFNYPAADLAVRKLSAMEALSRYQSFQPAMLGLVQIEPELWPLRARIDWWNLLEREKNIPEREKKLAHADQLLRSSLEWRGTIAGFREEASLWWLMNSPDVDAGRLLLGAATRAAWKDDIGRLVRGVIARQKRGTWDLTTANAWGKLAMERFSENFEKEEVTGETRVAYGKQSKTLPWVKKTLSTSVELPWAKGKEELRVKHVGTGKPWALLEARAALRLKDPIFKGYRAERKITPVQQKSKKGWAVGDIYRVTLTIDAPADMTWVAVTDPIPAGATILGSGLGGDSAMATSGEKYSAASITERSFSFFRSYFEWMPKGKHVVEYTVRLNAAGNFLLPNSRVEAMYAPEMYAEMPNGAFPVAE